MKLDKEEKRKLNQYKTIYAEALILSNKVKKELLLYHNRTEFENKMEGALQSANIQLDGIQLSLKEIVRDECNNS